MLWKYVRQIVIFITSPASIIDSAPRLGVCYFLSLLLSVCLSVCHAAPSNRFFFVSRWNRAIFCPSVLHVAPYKTVFFNFWFRPPIAQNLLPKICTCTKSPITLLVWQIDRRCLRLLGSFRGWPIQCNHVQCCGADPCCYSNEIGLFFDKIAYKSACMPDRLDMFGPTRGDDQGADLCCHDNDICARRGV